MRASLTRARQQPSTLSCTIFAVLSLLLLFLLFLLPLPPVSTHHAPSNLLLPSFSTPPSSPPFPRPFISRCLIFLVGLSSTPNHGSLHRTIAAESFRLEISTMRLSTALPAIPIACISPLQPLRYIIPGRATHPIQAGARIDREKEDSSRGINFSAILSLSFSAGRGNGHRRIFYAGGELELGWKEEWWGEGVAESLMKILAGGVRKAGEKGVARLLAAREARTKMAGNNEAAERTEIPGSPSPRSKQQNVRSIFNCVPGTELSTFLSLSIPVRVVDHLKEDGGLSLSPWRYRVLLAHELFLEIFLGKFQGFVRLFDQFLLLSERVRFRLLNNFTPRIYLYPCILRIMHWCTTFATLCKILVCMYDEKRNISNRDLSFRRESMRESEGLYMRYL